MRNVRKSFTLLTALMACVFAAQAHATVIDFESVATGGCQVHAGGSVAGFTLGAFDGNSGGGFNNATACSYLNPTANSGTQYMLNWNSLIAEFTKDVGTFTLNSVFVHSDIRVGGGTTVRFQGLDGVNGNVLHTLDLAIGSSWQQINFAGWTNVKTFTWDSLTPNISNISIDDFTYDVQPVPEPASMILFSSGLLGLAAYRRFKKNA